MPDPTTTSTTSTPIKIKIRSPGGGEDRSHVTENDLQEDPRLLPIPSKDKTDSGFTLKVPKVQPKDGETAPAVVAPTTKPAQPAPRPRLFVYPLDVRAKKVTNGDPVLPYPYTHRDKAILKKHKKVSEDRTYSTLKYGNIFNGKCDFYLLPHPEEKTEGGQSVEVCGVLSDEVKPVEHHGNVYKYLISIRCAVFARIPFWKSDLPAIVIFYAEHFANATVLSVKYLEPKPHSGSNPGVGLGQLIVETAEPVNFGALFKMWPCVMDHIGIFVARKDEPMYPESETFEFEKERRNGSIETFRVPGFFSALIVKEEDKGGT